MIVQNKMLQRHQCSGRRARKRLDHIRSNFGQKPHIHQSRSSSRHWMSSHSCKINLYSILSTNTSTRTNTWVFLKYRDSLHFSTRIENILAPDVFNYADSQLKSCHRATKIPEVFMDYKSPTSFKIKNFVFFHRPCYTINKNPKIFRPAGGGKTLKLCLKKRALFKYTSTSKQIELYLPKLKENCANKFYKIYKQFNEKSYLVLAYSRG